MHRMVNGVKVPLTPEEIKDIEAEWAKNKAEADAIIYKNKRKASYPDIADQLDMLWHAMDKGKLPKSNEFYKVIKKIKDENPKP